MDPKYKAKQHSFFQSPQAPFVNLEVNLLCGRLLLLLGNLPERRTDGLSHWITRTQVKTHLTTATRCKLSKQINVKKTQTKQKSFVTAKERLFLYSSMCVVPLTGNDTFWRVGEISDYLNTGNLSQCKSLHETGSGDHHGTKRHKNNSRLKWQEWPRWKNTTHFRYRNV